MLNEAELYRKAIHDTTYLAPRRTKLVDILLVIIGCVVAAFAVYGLARTGFHF